MMKPILTVCLLEGGGVLSLAAVLLSRSVERGILTTPVILVDDVIDSGWTMTMIAALLRMNRSGPVFPFALARATAGDS